MEANGTNGSLTVNVAKSSEISEASDKKAEKGLWRNVFAEYSENSTLHGVKYLGGKKLHGAERFFWVITFVLSGIGSYLFIMQVSV